MTSPTPQTGRAPNENARTRWTALALFLGPLIMFVGFLYHPFMPVLSPEVVAEKLHADETRWFVAHLVIAVGSAALALSFLALRTVLRSAGEERTSAWGLVFAVIGSALFILPPGMELGLLAGAQGGVDVVAAQTAMDVYFLPIFMGSNVLFLLGAVGFAIAARRVALVGPAASRVVAGALLAMALARFIPSGIQFYIGAVAGLVALWPVAYVTWQRASGAAEHRTRPAPTA